MCWACCTLASVLGPDEPKHYTVTTSEDNQTLMILSPQDRALADKEKNSLVAAFALLPQCAFLKIGFAPFAPGETSNNFTTVPNPTGFVFTVTSVLSE